jgi:Fe-S cluster assembly scaffold IscU
LFLKVGSFNKKDIDVGIGLVGAPACGDVMKLCIKVSEAGIIEDVRFKTFGCGSAIASSSYMTERVKGMTLEEAGAIRNTEIAKELSLPPVKLHCSMLAEDAIKSAIRDYKKVRFSVVMMIILWELVEAHRHVFILSTFLRQPQKRDASGNKAAGHIDISQSVTSGKTTATAHVGSGIA